MSFFSRKLQESLEAIPVLIAMAWKDNPFQGWLGALAKKGNALTLPSLFLDFFGPRVHSLMSHFRQLKACWSAPACWGEPKVVHIIMTRGGPVQTLLPNRWCATFTATSQWDRGQGLIISFSILGVWKRVDLLQHSAGNLRVSTSYL